MRKFAEKIINNNLIMIKILLILFASYNYFVTIWESTIWMYKKNLISKLSIEEI